MLDSVFNSQKNVLDPMERISEILFGLIMVLTVTCSFSALKADRKQVREMLLGAVGCNFAWGAIDAVFYLLARFSEQGRGMSALKALRKADSLREARTVKTRAPEPRSLRSVSFSSSHR